MPPRAAPGVTLPLDLWRAIRQQPIRPRVERQTDIASAESLRVQREQDDAAQAAMLDEALQMQHFLGILQNQQQEQSQVQAANVQSAESQQQGQMEELVEGFSPPTPSPLFSQTAVQRGAEDPIAEGRRLEGLSNVREFERRTQGMSPDEMTSLGPLNVALVREGMTPEEYTGHVQERQPLPPERAQVAERVTSSVTTENPAILEQWQTQNQDQVHELARRLQSGFGLDVTEANIRASTLLRANDRQWAFRQERVDANMEEELEKFRTRPLTTGIPGLEQIERGVAGAIGAFDPIRSVGGLVPDPVGSLVRERRTIAEEIGRGATGVDELGRPTGQGTIFTGLREIAEAPLEIGREMAQLLFVGKPGDIEGKLEQLKDVGGEVMEAFRGEQQVFAPVMRPLFAQTLREAGLPEGAIEPTAKLAAEIFVPSTLATIGTTAIGTTGVRLGAVGMAKIFGGAIAEGAVNAAQFHAGAEARGEEVPTPEELLIAFTAGAAGRMALEKVLPRAFEGVGDLLANVRARVGEPKFVTSEKLPLIPETPSGKPPPVQGAPTEGVLPATTRQIVPEVAEEVPTLVPRVEPPARTPAEETAAGLRFHGTTPEAAKSIRAEGTIRPTEAAPGTLRGVYLSESADIAALHGRTAARVGGAETAETISARRAPDLKIATKEEVDALKAELNIRDDVVPDMKRLTKELEERGFQGADASLGLGKARQQQEVIFDPKNVTIEGVPTRVAAKPKVTPETPAGTQLIREEDQAIVDRLGKRIRASKRVRGKADAPRKAELKRRAAVISKLSRRTDLTPQQQIKMARGAQKGELPGVSEFEALGEIADTDYVRLSRILDKHFQADPSRTFDWVNAKEALEQLWLGGNPVPSSRKLLEEAYGKKVMQALRTREPLPLRIGEEVLALGNVPRMIIAAYDMSMPLRQAVIQTVAHPVMGAKSFKQMIKAAISEDAAKQIERTLAQGPEAAIAREAKLETPGLFGGFGAAAREEAFQVSERTQIGQFIRKIPGIRISERGAVTYLNTLRRQLFDQELARAAKLGISYTDKDLKGIASFLNATTGRGDIGPLNQYSPVLNTMFFSSRLLAARVQTPFFLFSRVPRVRMMAARDLSRFVTTGLGILGLVKASGMGDVEVDPRSSDFGKIKVGPTRIDLWGGFQPIARYGAQVMSGQRKSALGDIQSISRVRGLDGALTRFIRSKLSPAAGLLTDVWAGETFLGEEFSADPSDIAEQVRQRLMPLFAQDMFDAFKEQGTLGLALASPGSVGITVSSYTSLGEKIQQALAEDYMKGYIRHDTKGEVPTSLGDPLLHPEDQRAFEERHPKLLTELEEMRAKQVEKGDPLATAFAGARQADEQKTEAIRNAATTLERGQTTRGQFRESVEAAMAADRGQRDLTSFLLEQAGFEPDERPEEGPQWLLDRFDYFALFERFPEANTNPEQKEALFQEIESFRSGIGRTRENELDEGLGLNLKDIPLYKELQDDKRIIRDSGWYDIWDNAWGQTRKALFSMNLPEDPDDYLRNKRAEIEERTDPLTASVIIRKDPVWKHFEAIRSGLTERWRMAPEHRPVMALLDKWEYRPIPIDQLGPVLHSIEQEQVQEGGGNLPIEDLLQQMRDNVNY